MVAVCQCLSETLQNYKYSIISVQAVIQPKDISPVSLDFLLRENDGIISLNCSLEAFGDDLLPELF